MLEYSFCTIVTLSHLPFAIALSKTIRRHHPETILTILLLDPPSCRVDELNGLNIVNPSDLKIPNFETLTLRYSAFALSNNLKPFLVEHVLTRISKKAILLDADIFVVGRFDTLIEDLDEAWFILTPHILQVALIDRSLVPARQIVELGVYNGGMWAFRAAPDALQLLQWLKKFLSNTDIDFADQKVLPLAAQLAGGGFRSLNDPGYNIAYWNLHERMVRRSGSAYFVDCYPVTFFHLSGFDDASPHILSKYLPVGRRGPIFCHDILHDYVQLLPDAPELRKANYRYDHYGNRRITPAMRRYYQRKGTFAGFKRHQAGALFVKAFDAISRLLNGK